MNLADPELELIDPTPNVHSMFLHFDKTFFWDKLSSRCVVRWSKRMYSCAGICSYDRGGLCDIALSEPLLKLRPRKDLVETLLHEMIHAFLFITRKDQDRDGHGPNFQAHMHRINRAAGLNISIYHDFHDEVKLYQTHWWRCDGPCQFQRPRFGIIRRTCNRAPGPSDYWWNSHKRNCGGSFIKIKEPEKPNKETKSKKNNSKPNADITKYINNNNNPDVGNKNIMKSNNPKKPVLKDSSNIPIKTNVGIKSNSSSTVVVTKKNVIFNPQVTNITKPKPAVFSGTGQAINGGQQRTSNSDVLEKVRNVWANKQLVAHNSNEKLKTNSTANTPLKLSNHKSDKELQQSPITKIKKIDDYFKNTASSILKDIYGQDFNVTQSKNNEKIIAVAKDTKKIDLNLVSCPVCNSNINANEINRHLDECLNKSVIDDLCRMEPKEKKSTGSNNENDRNKMKGIVTPPTFNKDDMLKTVKEESRDIIDLSIMELATDINRKRSRTTFDLSDPIKFEHKKPKKEHSQDRRKSDSSIFQNTSSRSQNNEVHTLTPIVIEKTIKVEPSCSKSDAELQKECPCCGDKLNTTVDEHLEECLSFFDNNTTIPEEGASTSFSNETIVIDDEDDDKFDETLTLNATGTKLPCPCCLKMVEEIDMNRHLDKCLS